MTPYWTLKKSKNVGPPLRRNKSHKDLLQALFKSGKRKKYSIFNWFLKLKSSKEPFYVGE